MSLTFSLPTLMGFILLVGIPFGWIIGRARDQRVAVASLEARGHAVVYDWMLPDRDLASPNTVARPIPTPQLPAWLLRVFGPDFFYTVVEVHILPDSEGEAGDVFKQVGRLNCLEKLRIDDHRVDQEALQELRPLHRLRWLSIGSGTGLRGCDLEALPPLKSLSYLSLFGVTSISDKDLAYLEKLKSLKILDIPYSEVTDSGLINLSGLKDLEELRFHGSKITSQGLRYLRGKNLRSLDLSGSLVDDLALLGDVSRMEEVYLGGTPISDAGLVPIKACRKLIVLNISGTRVTDASIPLLRCLTTLERLRINDNFTDQGIVYLRMALPKAEIK
jgi:hypothetical protein